MKNLVRLLVLVLLLLINLKLFASSISEYKNPIISNLSFEENSVIDEPTITETQILRLEFRVSSGASRSFVIGFAENTTDGFDYGYDGGLIQNPPPDDMGSLLNGQQYVIQAFAPITPDKEIDLVLHASGNFDYTLISTEISNFPEDQDLFLKDNLTGESFNLRSLKGYSFNSDPGTFTERFQVIFQDPASLSNQEFGYNNTLIYLNSLEDKFYAKSLTDKAVQLRIVNMLGQIVKYYHPINNQTLEYGIDISDLNTGIYMVSILTDNNNSIDKKVIVN
jgi:hypothetical protein